MKKAGYVILVLIFIAILAKACIIADTPTPITQEKSQNTATEQIIYPQNQKNITIADVDYLQSQAGIGIYGGSLVASTIGEGPKTFNPFNTKDNISAMMSEVMYDGLLTTDRKSVV